MSYQSKYRKLKYEIKGIIVSNTTEGNRDKLKSSNMHQKGGLSGKPLEEKSNIRLECENLSP